MRDRITSLIATVALLGAAGCGSDDDAADGDRAATTTTPAAGQVTTATTEQATPTTTAEEADGELSPRGRAVLAASQDLAADVGETAREFARGRIEQEEAIARLELAAERADDLRRRARELPAADRTRERLSTLNEEIRRTAAAVSREVSSGRDASRDEISDRIRVLRREAQTTVRGLSDQLDEPTRKRFEDALDRIGG